PPAPEPARLQQGRQEGRADDGGGQGAEDGSLRNRGRQGDQKDRGHETGAGAGHLSLLRAADLRGRATPSRSDGPDGRADGGGHRGGKGGKGYRPVEESDLAAFREAAK